eukprot:m.832953 g.832953  ORF g.832953 m.832953 type:complete len:343 (+) comp23441_c0_seq7:4353-5381(+)
MVFRLSACVCARHPLPRVLRPPGSPYINKSIFGYDKPVPKRSLPVDYQQHYSEILAFAQEHFIMFFSDDGDGVPHDTLIHLAERVLAPVLTCADMPTADLIAHFLLRSSARHGAVIRRAEALARTGSTAVASDADTSDDALPSATGQVNGQKTTVVVDPLGLTRTTLVAPRMPRTDREMSVVIRTVYDHSLEMLCLSVVDVAGCDPARVTLYYKLRVLPRYKTSTYKHRSDQQTKPDKWMFRAPGITNAVAVQLRVHEKHPLKKQQDTVLGEVLLNTEALVCSTRELTFRLTLLPLQHYDHLEEVLQLLSGRTQDAEAKDFMSMYPREHEQGLLSMLPIGQP